MNVILLHSRAGSVASGMWKERPLERRSRTAREIEPHIATVCVRMKICPLDPFRNTVAVLVCCRVIRYQSDLPLVSCGFSVASIMSRKRPPELESGIDRVLDNPTPTRDTFILLLGRLDVKSRPDPPSLRATLDAFNALMHAVP